jgi:hypothetical protein
MTHLASLHTIYDSLGDADRGIAREIFWVYKQFLVQQAQAGAYKTFYDYISLTPTFEVLENLEKLREKPDTPSEEKLKALPEVNETGNHRLDIANYARTALAALYKTGAFEHHENGFTYQALSVFVEKSSIGGCKSANERAQAVNGRVSILDFISLDHHTRDDLLDKYLSTENAGHIRLLANQLEISIKSIKTRDTAEIVQNLDALYQSLNLEGFQALISFVDQGGHAKLGTKKGLIPNTNNVETVVTHVKHTTEWQCHKGLTKYVLKEFCGVEKLNSEKEIGTLAISLGLGGLGGGAVGGTAVGIIFLIGLSTLLPPITIVIGLTVAIGAAGAGIVALGAFVYKTVTQKSAREKRVEAIEQENKDLIDEVMEENDVVKESIKTSHVQILSNLSENASSGYAVPPNSPSSGNESDEEEVFKTPTGSFSYESESETEEELPEPEMKVKSIKIEEEKKEETEEEDLIFPLEPDVTKSPK